MQSIHTRLLHKHHATLSPSSLGAPCTVGLLSSTAPRVHLYVHLDKGAITEPITYPVTKNAPFSDPFAMWIEGISGFLSLSGSLPVGPFVHE